MRTWTEITQIKQSVLVLVIQTPGTTLKAAKRGPTVVGCSHISAPHQHLLQGTVTAFT